jgi:hypothetical protein
MTKETSMSGRSKETVEVVRAALALAERDVELGLAGLDEIMAIPRTRFAPVERKQIVALLKAEGKSNRQVAKELNINPSVVDGDVREAAGKPRRKRADKPAHNAAKPAAKPRQAKLSGDVVAEANAFYSELGEFYQSFEFRFATCLEGKDLPEDVAETLLSLLHLCAGGLSQLALDVLPTKKG